MYKKYFGKILVNKINLYTFAENFILKIFTKLGKICTGL